jgi:hypothetical protein
MVFDFGVSKSGLLKILKLVSDAVGKTDTQILQNKTISSTDNTITSTSPLAGDILKGDGTKYIKFSKGSANQALKVNPAASDIEYGTLPVAGGGTGQATLSTGTVLIGAGTSGITTKANPAGAFLDDSSAQNITGLKTYSTTTLGYRNPAGTKTLTQVNPVILNDLNTQFNQFVDFYIFIDIDDSNKIKAKENRTGAIKYNHATDAGNVINSVIDDIIVTTPLGGIIALGPGTFNCTTGIVLKNYIKLIGSGYSTILKAANSSNIDVIKSLNFATLTGTNGTGGIHSFVLRDFVIDGNKANMSSGYGIRVYAYGYLIDNIILKDCKNDNIYSEWSTSTAGPSPHSMEAELRTIKSYQAGGRNITFRGPHDSRWFDIITFRAGTESVSVESVGSTYSGSCEMTGCHFWGNSDVTKDTLTITGANVTAYGVIAEGSTSGIGINVTSGGILMGKVNVFTNATGLLLHSQNNSVDVLASTNTVSGVTVDAAYNKITGFIQNNSAIGLNMSNYATLTDVTIDVHTRLNATHLNWAATHTRCDVTMHIVTAVTEIAVSGTIDKSRNKIRIYSDGAGTNFSNSETILIPAATEAQRFYRASATVGDSIGTVYALNDSLGNETTYAQILAEIQDATDGTEDGAISFYTKAAGASLTPKMFLSSTGSLRIGPNTRLRLVETGLTAARVFSYPDNDDTLLGLVAIQSPTNKTFDSTNTISSATSLPTVTVAKGGTGATTLTGILKGNGTSAVTAVTAPSGAILGDTDSQAITGKTIVAASNTITDTSAVAGDFLKHDGTRFVRNVPKSLMILSTHLLSASATNFFTIPFSSSASTEALADFVIDYPITVTRLRAQCWVNTKTGAVTAAIRDDGVDVTGSRVTITAATTGEYDSGALSVDVAAGSKISFNIDCSAAGTNSFSVYIIVECLVPLQ